MTEQQPSGWPDTPIQDLDDDEREALLNQAGPTGEAARQAWNQYQEDQERTTQPTGQAVIEERERLVEEGTIPPEPEAEEADEEAEEGEEGEEEGEAGEMGEAEAEMAGAVREEHPEASGPSDRAEAERKAAERGYTIRDWGTSGDWRVIDPKTGRQVARSALDEPLPTG
jgi:hypothetical protein